MKLFLRSLLVFAMTLAGSQGSALEEKSQNINPFQAIGPMSCPNQGTLPTTFTDCDKLVADECPGMSNTECSLLSSSVVFAGCCSRTYGTPGSFSNCPAFCSACGAGAKCFHLQLEADSCATYCAWCRQNGGECTCTGSTRICNTTGGGRNNFLHFGIFTASVLILLGLA